MTGETIVNNTTTSDTLQAPVTKNKKENLRQRAYLNSLSSMIDYAGIQITGFIINPFFVSGLGSAMYGVWQMLGQLTGYTKIADTRASQALKWSLAHKRDVVQEEEFKSDLTTAFIVTAITLPISLIVGGLLSWYAPQITHADEKYFTLIRATSAILISCLIINKFFDLFEAVLGGMNLGYKRMGLRALIVAFGGVLKVLVIVEGYGLIGLALVQVVISLVTGASFYFIVKKYVPWFAFGKTNKLKVRSFGKLSGWYMIFSTLKMLLLNTDKVLLGYLTGPVLVAKYSLTMFTSLAVQGAVVAVITGITPGISSLFGKGDYDKVKMARKAVISSTWIFTVSIGVAILIMNRSFIDLWVGKDKYAGNIENLFILLVTVQVVFFQLDSLIMNASLDIKRKVWLSSGASVLSFLLAILSVGKFGIIGLCISILIGRLFYTIGFPLLLKRRMKDETPFLSATQLRPAIVTIILFALATYAGMVFTVPNWIALILGGLVIFLVAGFIFWVFGMSGVERSEMKHAVSGMKILKMK